MFWSNTQRIFQTVPYNPSTPQLATKNAHSRARSPPTNTTFTSNTESIKTFHAKKHQEWKEDALSGALRNVNKCMTASNFIAPALLETARQNAQLFMEHGTVWKCHFSTISWWLRKLLLEHWLPSCLGWTIYERILYCWR